MRPRAPEATGRRPEPALEAASPQLAPPSRSGVLLMLVSSLLFATMGTLVGAAHQRDPSLDAWVTSAWRASVNLLTLLALTRGRRELLLGDGRAALWVRGFTGAASMIAYFGALMYLSVGEAAFLNQTSAVWVALLGPATLGEPTSPLVWLAVLGSLGGLGLLAHPRELSGDLLGRGLGLGSGLVAALAYLSVRRASATNPPSAIVFYFTFLASIIAVLGALLAGSPWPRDPVVMVLLAGSGVAATLAQLGMTRAYTLSPAAPVAAASAMSPLFSTVMGAIFLGQVPDGRARMGMVLLLVSGLVLPWLAERRTDQRR